VRRVGGSENRARRPGFDPLAQQAGRAKLRIDRQASVLLKVRHQRQESAFRLPAASSVRVCLS
jgi:hypothetical protein